MRGHVRAFLGVKPPLASLRDAQRDDRIPEHRAELVRRGLRGDPGLERAAKKFRPMPFRAEAW